MKRSWKGAFGEVALIFVGITLALFFENWSEDRQARIQEGALLAQILEDVRETRRDLTGGDLPGAEAAERAHHRLMENLYGNGVVEPDSVARDFAIVLNRGSRLYPQSAGYQSLRTVGVDLITDDSLRLVVTRFFELTLSRVARAESDLWESHDRYLEPYVLAHFQEHDAVSMESAGTQRGSDGSIGSLSSVCGGGTGLRCNPRTVYPRDLDALRRDPSFPLVMGRIQLDRSRLLTQYMRAENAMESVIEALELVVTR